MDLTGKLASTVGNNGTATRAVDTASSSAHGAIDKASAAVKPAVDRMLSGAHQAVDSLAGVASDAAETLGTKANQIREGQQRMTEQCRGHVRASPLVSIGIAVAAGFVLSRLIANR